MSFGKVNITSPAGQCWGKEAYQTPQLAVSVAKRMHAKRKQSKGSGLVPTPYRCPHCNLFHLGRRL